MSERIITLYEENAAAWISSAAATCSSNHGWRFATLLPPGGSVVDIGCGMGEPIARWLIERGFASPAPIPLLSDRPLPRTLPGHDWRVGDMRELMLGERFDGLIAWHSVFHLSPDEQRASSPLRRPCQFGAVLMFTSGHEAGEVIGEWQSDPLSMPARFRRISAPACGERLLARLPSPPRSRMRRRDNLAGAARELGCVTLGIP